MPYQVSLFLNYGRDKIGDKYTAKATAELGWGRFSGRAIYDVKGLTVNRPTFSITQRGTDSKTQGGSVGISQKELGGSDAGTYWGGAPCR